MSLIQWNASLSIGLAEMDAEHKKIAELINSLHENMQNELEHSKLQALIEEATHVAFRHFSHEEEIMRNYDYPSYNAHKNIHDGFVASLTEAKKLHEQNQLPYLQIVAILKNCLIDHIVSEDQKYAAFMRQNALV